MSIPRVPIRNPTLFHGWWVAGAASLVALTQVAFFNPVLGVFVTPLEDEFGWSRATIAGAITAGTILGALLSLLIGARIDRHGTRTFLTLSTLIMGVALLLLALVEEVWQFYILYAIGRGLVIGVVNLAITVAIANWFIRARGRATGLTLVGVRAGGALMPLVVLLFLSIADFRVAFLALGVIVLGLGVLPPWLVVRRRPEDLGLRPDGDPPDAPSASAESSAAFDRHWSVRNAIRTRSFWLLLIGTSQLFMVGGAVNFSSVPHLQDNGLSQTTAVTVITVWALMGALGGVLGGELRQRLPIYRALPAVLVIASLAIVWLILVDNVWMAYLFAVWHGLIFGMHLPLTQVAFPDYFGRWSVGAIRGITAPVQFGLNAAGPLIASLVFDVRGSFDLILAIFVGCYLFGAAIIAVSRPPSASLPRA